MLTKNAPQDKPKDGRDTKGEWYTRHSVLRTAQRAAALVNLLTAGKPTPENVAAVLRKHGETDPLEVSSEDVKQMRIVADSLRDVFASPDVDAAATRLNRLLAEGSGPARLTSHRGRTPWHIHLDSDDDAPWAEWLLASSCMAMAVLIWDRQRLPGGVCASPSCTNVYVTGGSGAPRRYCSGRCATRERVASHRRTRPSPNKS
ncbi:CGNR zinc finger domain-containing protein [Streptomyces sp. NPDC005808]|uniref:CGNR zinc finger domain-containing protein n=1 Tax=Streptomyces sp. NPDC005808 TaxID=3364734 RepID=UPI0036C8CE9E